MYNCTNIPYRIARIIRRIVREVSLARYRHKKKERKTVGAFEASNERWRVGLNVVGSRVHSFDRRMIDMHTLTYALQRGSRGTVGFFFRRATLV